MYMGELSEKEIATQLKENATVSPVTGEPLESIQVEAKIEYKLMDLLDKCHEACKEFEGLTGQMWVKFQSVLDKPEPQIDMGGEERSEEEVKKITSSTANMILLELLDRFEKIQSSQRELLKRARVI